jgi:hypothetical protein
MYILTNTDSWYYEMKYYLQHGSSHTHLDSKERRYLRLKSTQYQLIDGVLFKKIMMEYY